MAGFILFVIVVLLAMFLHGRWTKKDARVWQEFAHRQGLEYVRHVQHGITSLLRKALRIATMYQVTCSNVLTGQGEHGEFSSFHMRLHSEKGQGESRTVFVSRIPSAIRIPDFELGPRKLLKRLLRGNQLTVPPYEEPGQKLMLTGDDEATLRSLFAGDICEFLVDRTRQTVIVMDGHYVCFMDEVLLPQYSLPEFLDRASTMLDLLVRRARELTPESGKATEAAIEPSESKACVAPPDSPSSENELSAAEGSLRDQIVGEYPGFKKLKIRFPGLGLIKALFYTPFLLLEPRTVAILDTSRDSDSGSFGSYCRKRVQLAGDLDLQPCFAHPTRSFQLNCLGWLAADGCTLVIAMEGSICWIPHRSTLCISRQQNGRLFITASDMVEPDYSGNTEIRVLLDAEFSYLIESHEAWMRRLDADWRDFEWSDARVFEEFKRDQVQELVRIKRARWKDETKCERYRLTIKGVAAAVWQHIRNRTHVDVWTRMTT